MAVRNETPRLPEELGSLERYLRVRDTGAPAAVPVGESLTQSAIGDPIICEQDLIVWSFNESGLGQTAVRADGFVVYLEMGSTLDPDETQILVAADARSFSYIWPIGATRSYAVAAYRMTHQGMKVGRKVQFPSWRGIESIAESEAGGGGGGGCLTVNATLEMCTLNFGNEFGVIYGTQVSAGLDLLALFPSKASTSATPGGIRGIAFDPFGATMTDHNMVGMFWGGSYTLQAPNNDIIFSLASVTSQFTIDDSSNNIGLAIFSPTSEIIFTDQQAVDYTRLFGDLTRYKVENIGDGFVRDHLSFLSLIECRATDPGDTVTLDNLTMFYGALSSAGSGTKQVNTARGLHLNGRLSGSAEPRIWVGIELDDSPAEEEQWSIKSHSDVAWFYHRGQAMFGSLPLVQTTLAADAFRGDAFIDVVDASDLFSGGGMIRAGFETTTTPGRDRYFRYSSITLGGGAGGSDRINLDQDLFHDIATGTNVFQYTAPNAQVEIWQNADGVTALELHVNPSTPSSLLDLFDASENSVLRIDQNGIPSGTIEAGVFTPTPSATVNLDSVTVNDVQYVRVGSTVTVSGTFSADPTTTLLATSFEIDLPVASNLATELAGTAGVLDGSTFASVSANSANDTASIQWLNRASTSVADWVFHFTYRII